MQRGKRKTTEILDQFCIHGHDTWITGRIANGHCKGCLVSGFCSNGHDVSVTGKTLRGKCKKCDSGRRSRYSKSALEKQYCPDGHDTFSLGRTPAGACSECARNYAREKYGYKKTLADLETACKNGHPWNEENTVLKTKVKAGKSSTYKECRVCIKDRNLRYEAKKKKKGS
jgi:hypothetical protein